MSKKGRQRNRERRALASNPGATWTATRAAEQALAAKNEVAERYLANPMLHVIESGNYRSAVAERTAAVMHSMPDDVYEVYPDAITEGAHMLVTGTPMANLPDLPEDILQALRKSDCLPGDAMLADPEAHRGLRAAHQVITTHAAALSVAETYIISPAMHAATAAAAATLDPADYLTWSEGDVPAEIGFLHLPYTQVVTLGGDRTPKDLRAISWRLRGLHLPDGKVIRAVSITGWVDADGPVQAPHFNEARRNSKRNGYPFPRLIKDFQMPVALDQYQDGVDASVADEVKEGLATRGLRDLGDAMLGEHVGGDIEDPVGDFEVRYLFAFMRLAAQQVATLSRPPAMHDNGLRTRPDAMDVRVVQLRAADPQKPEGVEYPTREYKHRHVVRMHKVRQWYPSEQRHKVIWRGPYIRGPEGAPLLMGEKVQALVR